MTHRLNCPLSDEWDESPEHFPCRCSQTAERRALIRLTEILAPYIQAEEALPELKSKILAARGAREAKP